jgi:hypothetical protein
VRRLRVLAIGYGSYVLAFSLAVGAAIGAGLVTLAFAGETASTVTSLVVLAALAWPAAKLGHLFYQALQPPRPPN